MGVSYQTPNRLRRKVMTAPLVAPAIPVVEVEASVPMPLAPLPAPKRALAWPAFGSLVLAVAVAIAVVGHWH